MRTLVLSGGGAKGAMQIACVAELYRQGKTWDNIVGVSAGALNAAGIAFFGAQQSREFWKTINKKSDILSMNIFSLLWKQGLYSLSPLEKILQRTFRDLPGEFTPFWTGTTDLAGGEVSFQAGTNDTSILIPNLIHSCTIPAIMESSGLKMDGGVRDTVPLSYAIKGLLSDDIDVVMCQTLDRNQWLKDDGWKPTWPKILSIANRAVDILSSEVTWGDIEMCRMRNNQDGFRKVSVNIYAPVDRPPLDTLDFEKDLIHKGIEYGISMAKEPVMVVS